MVEAKVQGLRPSTQLGTEFLAYVIWAVSLRRSRGQSWRGSPERRRARRVEDDDAAARLLAVRDRRALSRGAAAQRDGGARERCAQEHEGPTLHRRQLSADEAEPVPEDGQPACAVAGSQGRHLSRCTRRATRWRSRSREAPTSTRRRSSRRRKAGSSSPRMRWRERLTRRTSSRSRKQTTQASEDARALTAERVEQERIATERAAAAAQAKSEAEAKAAAEAAAAKQRADLEAQRQAELAAAREAQLKAEAAARKPRRRVRPHSSSRRRPRGSAIEDRGGREGGADAGRGRSPGSGDSRRTAASGGRGCRTEARIEAEAAAREASAKADAERARAAAETLRAQLLEQFNRILETRDTVRGLVITMADVLFDTGKYDLRPPTREALARLSGVVLSHPGLKLEVEGHTDSTGSDELNQTLSQQRAETVRGYLVQQGLPGDGDHGSGLRQDHARRGQQHRRRTAEEPPRRARRVG